MFEVIEGIRSILAACQAVRPGDRVLVLADNEGQSTWLGQIVMNVANSMQAEAVLAIINPPEQRGAEPPASIAAAMKSVDVTIRVSNKASLVHSTARKEATAAGARYNPIDIPFEDIKNGASSADVLLIKERTEALAQLLTKANKARVTTPAGTDITVNLAGRTGIPLHPLSPLVGGMPYYAEAAIAPVEGSAEGLMVIDIAFIDWDYVLRKPMYIKVKGGKAVDVQGDSQDVEKLQKVLGAYKNASNIGELGIGTSHVVPLPMHGTRRDAARIGTAHFALGRNNDIGGETLSEVHWDALMDKATVELDGRRVLHKGALSI
jgi:leucyl aminopeptidase (aminopeptidase T)